MPRNRETEKDSQLKAKFICPPKLQEFIDLVNILEKLFSPNKGIEYDGPIDWDTIEEFKTYEQLEFPSQREITKKGIEIYGEHWNDNILHYSWEMMNAIYAAVDFLPDIILAYIFPQLTKTQVEDATWRDEHDYFKTVYENFDSLVIAQEVLVDISFCDLITEVEARKNNFTSTYGLDSYQKTKLLANRIDLDSTTQQSPKIYTDSKGVIRVKTNNFILFLQEHEIETGRIRACLNCENIFWATRSDMFTCQKSCGNAFRQKKWREGNREEYNAKRRENRIYKKKRLKTKIGKAEKNGTL